MNWKLEGAHVRSKYMERPTQARVHVGLMDGVQKSLAENAPFIYFDNSYFRRDPRGGLCRVIRNGMHLTSLLDRPDDRRKLFNIKLAPWRKTGRDVIVIPPSRQQRKIFPNAGSFVDDTLRRLGAVTDRRVIVKWEKHVPILQEMLLDAWAVVTYCSAAALESALFGVPVFSTRLCVGWAINAGELEDIEAPEYKERDPWLNSLAYSCWDINDKKIHPDRYDYQ